MPTIYRKPAKKTVIIQDYSNQPPQHKMESFHSLLKDINDKTNIIYKIAEENGYSRKTIIKIEN